MTDKKDGVAQATEAEHLDLRSHDIAEERRQDLLRPYSRRLGPRGASFDVERLKLVLGKAVDVGKERYGMTCEARATGHFSEAGVR